MQSEKNVVGNMECIKCKKEIPAGSVFCCWCGKKQEAAPKKALKRANGTGTVYKLQGRRTRPWVAAKGKTIISDTLAKKQPPLRRLRVYRGGVSMKYTTGRSRKFTKRGRMSISGISGQRAKRRIRAPMPYSSHCTGGNFVN